MTLNLDTGIENAMAAICNNLDCNILVPSEISQHACAAPWILHLHGKYSSDPLTLGLTLENISKGIPRITQETIIDAIRNAKTIVFVGYGGGDVFDVNPFLRAWRSSNTIFPRNMPYGLSTPRTTKVMSHI